jgi:hypothetical protein
LLFDFETAEVGHGTRMWLTLHRTDLHEVLLPARRTSDPMGTPATHRSSTRDR